MPDPTHSGGGNGYVVAPVAPTTKTDSTTPYAHRKALQFPSPDAMRMVPFWQALLHSVDCTDHRLVPDENGNVVLDQWICEFCDATMAQKVAVLGKEGNGLWRRSVRQVLDQAQLDQRYFINNTQKKCEKEVASMIYYGPLVIRNFKFVDRPVNEAAEAQAKELVLRMRTLVKNRHWSDVLVISSMSVTVNGEGGLALGPSLVAAVGNWHIAIAAILKMKVWLAGTIRRSNVLFPIDKILKEMTRRVMLPAPEDPFRSHPHQDLMDFIDAVYTVIYVTDPGRKTIAVEYYLELLEYPVTMATKNINVHGAIKYRVENGSAMKDLSGNDLGTQQ